MLKGVNQWCFPNQTPLEEVFAVSRKAGFDTVELNVYEPGNVGLTTDTTPEEAKAIRRQAEAHGIKLRSLSTGLLWGCPLSSADAEVRAQGREVISKQLELAEALEIDTVLVVPGKVDPETSYDACYERSQAELKLLSKAAEARGVRIGVENVWNNFLLSPLEMARYVDELQSSHIGVYFDVGNVLKYGFPEQWIRILGQRIFRVHVKDFRPAVGTFGGFVPLLAGDVNWSAVRTALQEIGYSESLTAEISPYAGNGLQAVYDTARQIACIIDGEAR